MTLTDKPINILINISVMDRINTEINRISLEYDFSFKLVYYNSY